MTPFTEVLPLSNLKGLGSDALEQKPACSLQTCTALFSSFLAANLHTVLSKTLGIYFGYRFL